MLYIYKIIKTPFIAKCATDAQAMHKHLCGLVHTDRASANLLYKLDIQHGCLFLQSDIQPDESPYFQLIYKVDIDTILSKKKTQEKIHFHLTTNAHMKRTVNGITKKVYVPRERLESWVTEKLQRNGLNVYTIKEIAKQNVSFVHLGNCGGYANVTTHEFDIYGEISDMNLLCKAWKNGLGDHKAYGNGLFLLYQ